MKYGKSIFLLSLTFFVTGLLVDCRPPKAPDKRKEYDANYKKAIKGNDQNVLDEDTSQFISSRGIVKSMNEIPISAPINGKVVGVYVTMGQQVKKGQVLVKLDDSQHRIKIKHAKAILMQCQHKYTSILLGLGYKLEDISKATPEQKSEARIGSNIDVAEAEYEMLCEQLHDYVIKAPIDGTICQFDNIMYKYVNEGTALLNIVDEKNLMVTFEVLEREIGLYQIGSKIQVCITAFGTQTFNATVTKLSPRISDNAMVLVEASLPYSSRLKVGMIASIKRVK